jgi:hypothetical protein
MTRFLRALAFTLIAPAAPMSLMNCGGRTEPLDLDADIVEPPGTDTGPSIDTGPDSLARLDARAMPDTYQGPDTGREEINPTPTCPPPANVNSGLACRSFGLACPSGTLDIDCNGKPTIPVNCRCNQGMWNCAHVALPCPTQPMCPPFTMVRAGGTCAVPSGTMCQSAMPIYGCAGAVTGYLPCECSPQGQWNCAMQVPPSCVDASPPPPETCPDPTTLMEGTACTSNGLQCKGNPTVCGGATFYDALQCNGSKFVTVAGTLCGIDGGADAGLE